MEVIKFIQLFSNPVLDTIFQIITMSGEDNFILIVAMIILWCVNKEFGYKLGLAMTFNITLNVMIKEIFHIERPIGKEGIRSLRTETATGYSFPSGHTQSAASLWISVMIKLKRAWVYVAGILIVLMVGLSRMYLGVHTPTDVIGGILIGTAGVFISNILFEYMKKSGNKKILLVYLAVIAAGAFFGSSDYYKAAGVGVGFILGYIIESKYIQYETRANLSVQIFKILSGVALILIIRVLLKKILPETPLWDFIRYFVIGLMVVSGMPYLFKQYIRRILLIWDSLIKRVRTVIKRGELM